VNEKATAFGFFKLYLNIMQTENKRARANRVSMRVSDHEKAQLQQKAQSVGLSLSAYLIMAGLDKRLRSKVDQQAIVELAKLRADLGRLGGLLKYWLTGNTLQHPKAHITDIRQLLAEITDTQETIKTRVDALDDR
jgi:hypothetical protein